jgi:pre-rRNA-processing protein TSR1
LQKVDTALVWPENRQLTDFNIGKIESRREDRGKRRTPHQQVMSKIARRNQGKQLRMHQHEKKDNESSIFQGKDRAPKHIAVVPLSLEVDVSRAIKQLNDSVHVTDQTSDHDMTKVKVDRFKRHLLYMPAKYELIRALDLCQLADWVVLVLAAEQHIGEEEDQFIRALEGQGISNVLCVIQGVTEAISAPRRSKIITEAKSEMARYLPNLDKLWILDYPADCANVVRSLCTASSRGVRWRDQRSWMLIENIEWKAGSHDQGSSTITVTGTVRGRALNPDRLIHIPGWGDFQIRQITEFSQRKTQNGQEDKMEDVAKRHVSSPDQDDLLTLAPEDEEMQLREASSTVATDTHKGVLLDDHHYFSDDNSHIPPPPKRLPKGTSAYQAAWYLDNVSDSDSDMVDDENENMDVSMDIEPEQLGPEDGANLADPMDATTEAGPSEYPESEMHIDRSANEEAEAIEEFRKSRKEAEDDLEFPDEIELHPNVLARERLAKYRGLKGLRTSEWNVDADAPYEPSDYHRLLKIADYKNSHNAAVRETLAGGVPAGGRVEIELANVPTSFKKSDQPVSIFSLLRHEHQSVVVNLNVTLSSALSEPVRSKEELIVQVGPRRLIINPVFSAAGSTPNDVHKFDRFLHPGRTAIASFLGPLTWGSVPVLVFKDAAAESRDTQVEAPTLVEDMDAGRIASSGKPSQQLRLIGTATTIPPSSSRVIAKRVILTGHPYKIHKKLVTIRYMFFNKEDVAWFSALPLWTKRGRQGFIKESLGTHGYFKATFDGKINPMDAVGVSLYKRVFPRPAKMWTVEKGSGDYALAEGRDDNPGA